MANALKHQFYVNYGSKLDFFNSPTVTVFRAVCTPRTRRCPSRIVPVLEIIYKRCNFCQQVIPIVVRILIRRRNSRSSSILPHDAGQPVPPVILILPQRCGQLDLPPSPMINLLQDYVKRDYVNQVV